MKRFSMIGIFALLSTGSFAQDMTGYLKPQTLSIANCGCSGGAKNDKGKFLTFGFELGANRSNLKFGETQTDGDQITNGLGYRLGVLSNLQFTQRFSIAPKVDLSFNAGRLDQSDNSYNVNAVNLEFMGHLKYKFAKSNFSPYILSGPNYRAPINRDNAADVPVRSDWAIDFGAGLDIPLGVFKISPEVRYSYGLNNITNSNNFSDLKFHNIALVVVFSDN